MRSALLAMGIALSAASARADGVRPEILSRQPMRLDGSVVDEKRQPVRGLKESDFTVLVDGKPRPIRAFEAVDHAPVVAATKAAGAPVPAGDVATNRGGNDNPSRRRQRRQPADVFELDGRPIRDREERLSRILQVLTARATCSDFREFKVTTSESIK